MAGHHDRRTIWQLNYQGKEWLNVSFHSEPTNEIQRRYDSVTRQLRIVHMRTPAIASVVESRGAITPNGLV